MNIQLAEIYLLVLGYLMGSIPIGKIIGSSYGVDIQKRGSGNIGFANVRRVLGWRAGLITLAADVTKGFLPTLLASYFVDGALIFFVGLAAILGHIFPVWLKFRGGKGIATGLGVVLVINPIAGIVGAFIYLISCQVIKVSSHSSMIGLLATAVTAIVISPESWWEYLILLLTAMWTLRKNLTGKLPNYDT